MPWKSYVPQPPARVALDWALAATSWLAFMGLLALSVAS